MARIINTVGSLSALKNELEKRKITQFSSIKEINKFERTYDQQIENIRNDIRRELKTEFEIISTNLPELEKIIKDKKIIVEEELNETLYQLNNELATIENNKNDIFHRFIMYVKGLLLRRKIKIIINNKNNYIERIIENEKNEKIKLEERLDKIKYHSEEIEDNELYERTQKIRYIKASIDELHPIILGSIGESMVSSKLSSLPDNYVVINNVYIELYEPIYYPSENDRIYSFQIDHVVVGPTGIFAIETKHWGQKTISNNDLFSPVKQVRRSGYALYRMINNGFLNLTDSWGERDISVHNIIALTACQVKQKYLHVKILDINSINNYILWFNEGLSIIEIDKIVSYLEGRCIK